MAQSEEPDVIVVSDKGQVVIPAHLRNKLGLKPRSKLVAYGMNDTIVLKKLTLPDTKKEMQALWREIDKKISKYGEITEDEIQRQIEEYRSEKKKRT
ncbi:MAG TPA: AbrB/MazE/SpoVT family DNA-binding domain-containing protein [Nitrososphaerales archaeon]|nr:AbrB/MazE/SpoVT family DNA-binding domain-containing protein [Nitrososphaerales archaeon]